MATENNSHDKSLSLRARVYQLLDENHDLTAKQLAEKTGTKQGACSFHKTRWKESRGIPVARRSPYNSKNHSAVRTIKPPATPATEPLPSEEVQQAASDMYPFTAEDVACELLKQSVKSVTDYADILEDRKYWRTYAISLEAQLKKAEEERDRIKQIHNTMVELKNKGKIPTLEEVVKVLRRSQVQPLPRL